MKYFMIFSLLGLFSLVLNTKGQPPKKRIPVDKSVKIPLIYKNYKMIVTSEVPNNKTVRILIDTTKNKKDTIFVES